MELNVKQKEIKEKCIELLKSTKREGMDKLIDFLENKSDFFTDTTPYTSEFFMDTTASTREVLDQIIRIWRMRKSDFLSL